MIHIKQRVLSETQAHFAFYREAIIPGSHILDIGTGTGFAAEYIRTQIAGLTITGLDIEEHSTYPHGISRVIYDGNTMPFPDKSFDTGLLFYTLHHAWNPGQILSEASRVLRKNLIIIEESELPGTDHADELEKEAEVYNALGLSPGFHHNGLSNKELEALLSRDHFHIQLRQHLSSRTVKRVQKILYVIKMI